MHAGTKRTLAALTGAMTLFGSGLLTAPSAQAGPPIRDADIIKSVDCLVYDSEGREGEFFLGDSQNSGPNASIYLPTAEGWVMGGGTPTWGADTWSVDLVLADPEGNDAGRSHVWGTWELTDEVHTQSGKEHNGNSWSGGSLTSTEMNVAIEGMTVAGFELGKSYCSGSLIDYTYVASNPSAQVMWSRELTQIDRCEIMGPGVIGEVIVGQSTEGHKVDFVVEQDGAIRFGGVAAMSLRRSYASGIAPTTAGEYQPVGDSVVTLQLSRTGERALESERGPGLHVRRHLQFSDATVTLTLPDGTTAAGTCSVADIKEHISLTPSGANG